MAFFEMLLRVALVRTNVSEEPSASIINVTRIGGLGTTPGLTSNQHTHCEEISIEYVYRPPMPVTGVALL
jgi:hypothetical protein